MSDMYRHLGGGGTMSDADFALHRLRRAIEAEKQTGDGSQTREIIRQFEELDGRITEQGELPDEWLPEELRP